jgi:hypothetical protein
MMIMIISGVMPFVDQFILSRVRDSVTNNNGLWIGCLDLLALLLQLHLITTTYNSSQAVTTQGSFRFLHGLRASSTVAG